MTDNKYIPVNEPCIEGNERKYLSECIDRGWISSEGSFVTRFESDYAGFINVNHGIAVSSGTAALETALYALGVKQGDEVIMPAFTIISCAVACLRLGARPVLTDIDPLTWNMDVASVEARITEKTRVIMPVHMYGHPVDMDVLIKLARKYDIAILEDAAEAHGAEYRSRDNRDSWYKCGALGDIAATSFYANKIITTGEGGMVLTNSGEFAERARAYRNLCFGTENRFCHTDIGFNFRMTNLQAAVGVAQLEKINEFLQIKASNAALYRDLLADVPGISFMKEEKWARHAYWMYCVILDSKYGVDAASLIRKLDKRNIGARPFFYGLHNQPALEKSGLFKNEKYPVTDHASKYGFYLPSSLSLTHGDIKRVTDILKQELSNHAGV
ncbi:MAG TPA: DegT/DnrJ/EryC1/StrS family aminotransferase [Gammaproteobacteria bacterium]|nr:DegT/DnrJ/EryC1/StrS family aminotransferase [Gammaproteobacteria bacterium]